MTFGSTEFPGLSLMFSGSLNVSPPSVLLAKKISRTPGVASSHTVQTLSTGVGGGVDGVGETMNSLSLLFIHL